MHAFLARNVHFACIHGPKPGGPKRGSGGLRGLKKGPKNLPKKGQNGQMASKTVIFRVFRPKTAQNHPFLAKTVNKPNSNQPKRGPKHVILGGFGGPRGQKCTFSLMKQGFWAHIWGSGAQILFWERTFFSQMDPPDPLPGVKCTFHP